ncbi:potassium:proton antiporter [Aureococcus anophagefferens]|nr:potassium:proton antiporter [Aureococcus anophagefferens]
MPRVEDPHAEQAMEELEDAVEEWGGDASMLDGWRTEVHDRPTGSSAGTTDRYYFDEFGKRFRSKAEIARALGLAAPARARRRGARAAARPDVRRARRRRGVCALRVRRRGVRRGPGRGRRRARAPPAAPRRRGASAMADACGAPFRGDARAPPSARFATVRLKLAEPDEPADDGDDPPRKRRRRGKTPAWLKPMACELRLARWPPRVVAVRVAGAASARRRPPATPTGPKRRARRARAALRVRLTTGGKDEVVEEDAADADAPPVATLGPAPPDADVAASFRVARGAAARARRRRLAVAGATEPPEDDGLPEGLGDVNALLRVADFLGSFAPLLNRPEDESDDDDDAAAPSPAPGKPKADENADPAKTEKPPDKPGAPALGAEWRTEGPHVGMWITRAVYSNGKQTSSSVGLVEGYLPPEEADFLDDAGAPAALWSVRYVSGELAGDREDLEAAEVEESGPRWVRPPRSGQGENAAPEDAARRRAPRSTTPASASSGGGPCRRRRP